MELIFGTTVVNALTIYRNSSDEKLLRLTILIRIILIRMLAYDTDTILQNPTANKKMKVHRLEKSSGQVQSVCKRCHNCYKKVYEEHDKKHVDSNVKTCRLSKELIYFACSLINCISVYHVLMRYMKSVSFNL